MDTKEQVTTELGGFEEAAEILTGLSGRTYSRQGVHQLWKRRDVNGFPDRVPYSINGRPKLLFEMDDVVTWYAFPEAAALLTDLAGKHYNSADVWLLWTLRFKTGFPEMQILGDRKAFAPEMIEDWYHEASNAVDETRELKVS